MSKIDAGRRHPTLLALRAVAIVRGLIRRWPGSRCMKLSDALLSVWKQALVEDAKSVELERKTYPIKRTSRNRLRQVDFEFDGVELRGLEQNPETKSRWAQQAREGKKVMQFLSGGRYVANAVDGKATIYGKLSR